jgi:2-polyprenyl-3-methyl-5-hydroxy-6-metoxy-1,4-benzoquinol methylase
MRQITCPICNTPPSKSAKSQSIIPCQNCDTCWTFLPEEVDAASLYSDEVYAIVDNRKSIFERIIFFEAEKILKKARKINRNAQSVLDFGSGKGQFLAVAKKMGWTGLGIETAQKRADFAKRNYGVQVQGELYFGGKIGAGNFDLITLNHVLEHLPEPLDLVKSLVEENLSPKGLIYIEVPRADSWQAQVAGKNWMHWDIPRHLTHWSAKGLKDQMRKIEFEIVEKRSFSVHLGVLGMLQALLSRIGFGDNLILRLKRKKSVGLLVSIAILLPVAWILELLSTGFGKSGILGIYLKRSEAA